MKKQYAFSIFAGLFLILAGTVISGSGKAGDAAAAPAIGATIQDFSLPDTDGKAHPLSSLKGKNGAVLIFISVQCPVSNAYNERMTKLAEDYAARGVSVIGINSNKSESADAVKAHATEKHLNFTILKDSGNKVADLLGAQHTPEAYFLDANNRLLYHGRIDNSTDTSRVESNDLREALDATLAGKPIQKATSLAFGCSIKRVGS
jgi:peroxiredoxin